VGWVAGGIWAELFQHLLLTPSLLFDSGVVR